VATGRGTIRQNLSELGRPLACPQVIDPFGPRTGFEVGWQTCVSGSIALVVPDLALDVGTHQGPLTQRALSGPQPRSLISFSRKTASHFPRPRPQSQTTTSMTARQTQGYRHRAVRGACLGGSETGVFSVNRCLCQNSATLAARVSGANQCRGKRSEMCGFKGLRGSDASRNCTLFITVTRIAILV
jgi:hypothetical protein